MSWCSNSWPKQVVLLHLRHGYLHPHRCYSLEILQSQQVTTFLHGSLQLFWRRKSCANFVRQKMSKTWKFLTQKVGNQEKDPLFGSALCSPEPVDFRGNRLFTAIRLKVVCRVFLVDRRSQEVKVLCKKCGPRFLTYRLLKFFLFFWLRKKFS